MSEEQFTVVLRWFETLSGSIETMRADMAGLRNEVHEIRELLGHLQDDDRVQRQAIANLDRRVEAVEHRP